MTTMSAKMEILVLMAQRKCKYEGQYAPEALACMSEHEYADNPDYLNNARIENLETGEFDSVEIVALEVGVEDLHRRLFPQASAIKAEIGNNSDPRYF